MIDVSHLTYRYGRQVALSDLSLTVPAGGLYALLGPNGSGKTTLLQIIMGLRKTESGRVRVMGRDVNALSVQERGEIAYIAEGQSLPGWMNLAQLEAFLAPLYPHWDHALARELQVQFELDPHRRIGTLSRGEHMKAALICALAPRPKPLIMDEPFTGMDALVKDDLVRGLLRSSGSEGWTVLLCSHDIGELELLADSIGLIDHGHMKLSATMDEVRERFHAVEVAVPAGAALVVRDEWLAVDHTANRATFVMEGDGDALHATLGAQLPAGARIDIRTATLREVFIALSRPRARQRIGVAA